MTEDRLAQLAELAEAGLSAASLVHEARQPLFAMKALAQLARGDGLSAEKVDELLELMGHLETLLDAWTDVGRREPERLFDARLLAEQVQRMLAGRIRMTGAQVTVDSGPPLWAHGTPSIPRQVVLNLLQNACDAVEGMDERLVQVALRSDSSGFEIEVTDTGPGLPDEVSKRVFEPFVTTKEAGRGSGLGLYVARRLCLQAGGDLSLESTGTGTRALARFAWTAVPA